MKPISPFELGIIFFARLSPKNEWVIEIKMMGLSTLHTELFTKFWLKLQPKLAPPN